MESVRLKILVTGPHMSGKSCLIKNYCEGRFVKRYLPTIGIDYGVRSVDILGQKVKVNFFDASGAPEFKAIRTEFYREAQAVCYVVDITEPSQLQECLQFVAEARDAAIGLQYLIATKLDLNSKISDTELTDFAKKINARLFKANSMTGDGVEALFTQIFKEMVLMYTK